MKQIPLADATLPQLQAFARNALSFELDPDMDIEDARSVVNDAWQGDNILLIEDEQPAAAPMVVQPEPPPTFEPPPAEIEPENAKMPLTRNTLDTNSSRDPKIVIRIRQTDEPGGSDPVPVSVNGIAIRIPREKDVTVAKRFVDALQNAERYVYDYNEENGETTRRTVKAYSFDTIRVLPPAAVAA